MPRGRNLPGRYAQEAQPKVVFGAELKGEAILRLLHRKPLEEAERVRLGKAPSAPR